jgi:hypothetical protein
VLTIGGSPQLFDDRSDLIEIREIKRHVRSYGKADAMRIDRDAAYKIEDFGALPGAAIMR